MQWQNVVNCGCLYFGAFQLSLFFSLWRKLWNWSLAKISKFSEIELDSFSCGSDSTCASCHREKSSYGCADCWLLSVSCVQYEMECIHAVAATLANIISSSSSTSFEKPTWVYQFSIFVDDLSPLYCCPIEFQSTFNKEQYNNWHTYIYVYKLFSCSYGLNVEASYLSDLHITFK